MRDWYAIVNEKLAGLGLPMSQEHETVHELASHLEDQYEEGCAQGLSDSEAFELTLNEVTDWRRLAREIHRAKRQEETMKYRTKSLWIPGLVTGFLAMTSLSMFSHAGLPPRIIFVDSTTSLQLPIQWLFMLPLFGALGAYLSRRADGHRMTRVAAALSPSIVLLGMFLFSLVVSMFVDRNMHTRPLPFLFGPVTFNWVVLPGAALFLGALPFLRSSRMRDVGQASC